MNTKLSLSLSITNCLAKVKHALILPNIFNFMLKVTQFVQAYF